MPQRLEARAGAGCPSPSHCIIYFLWDEVALSTYLRHTPLPFAPIGFGCVGLYQIGIIAHLTHLFHPPLMTPSVLLPDLQFPPYVTTTTDSRTN